MDLYSIYLRVIEGLGLEGTFKIILLHLPAMGRVTFHCPRLLLPWSWTLPGMVQLHLLWEIDSNASPHSQERIVS